jgi:hypothetical protein
VAVLEARNIDKPDERRDFPQGYVEAVHLPGGVIFDRTTFGPGWRWSEAVKPIAGTDSCMFHHVGWVVSGRMHIRHDDGAELEIGPGDAVVIEPGHDAWTVGDEDCVMVDFTTEDDPRFAAPG